MSRTTAHSRKKGRASLLWIAVSVLLVIILLYLEQVAMLYVLATLSVAGLLAVVALSDLRGAREVSNEPSPHDDSAAIADGATNAAVATSFGSAGRRAARHQKRR
jgi:hypothetical protein